MLSAYLLTCAQAVDYATQGDLALAPTPEKPARDRDQGAEASDTDFEAQALESDDDDEELRNENEDDQDITRELSEAKERRSRSKYGDPVFKRVHVAPPVQPPFSAQQNGFLDSYESQRAAAQCIACGTIHVQGSCPLKIAGTELCGLCGQAHYGAGFRKACTHLHSIEQCQLMLEAVKSSPEPQEIKDFVKKYLVGIIGNLRHDKKIAEEKKRDSVQSQSLRPPPGSNQQPYGPPQPNEYQYLPNGIGYMRPYQVNGIGMGKENQPAGFSAPTMYGHPG